MTCRRLTCPDETFCDPHMATCVSCKLCTRDRDLPDCVKECKGFWNGTTTTTTSRMRTDSMIHSRTYPPSTTIKENNITIIALFSVTASLFMLILLMATLLLIMYRRKWCALVRRKTLCKSAESGNLEDSEKHSLVTQCSPDMIVRRKSQEIPLNVYNILGLDADVPNTGTTDVHHSSCVSETSPKCPETNVPTQVMVNTSDPSVTANRYIHSPIPTHIFDSGYRETNSGPKQATTIPNSGPSQATSSPNSGTRHATSSPNSGPSQATSSPNSGPSQATSSPNSGTRQATSIPNSGPGQAISSPDSGPREDIPSNRGSAQSRVISHRDSSPYHHPFLVPSHHDTDPQPSLATSHRHHDPQSSLAASHRTGDSSIMLELQSHHCRLVSQDSEVLFSDLDLRSTNPQHSSISSYHHVREQIQTASLHDTNNENHWETIMGMFDTVDQHIARLPFIAGMMLSNDRLEIHIRPSAQYDGQTCCNRIRNLMPPGKEHLLIIEEESAGSITTNNMDSRSGAVVNRTLPESIQQRASQQSASLQTPRFVPTVISGGSIVDLRAAQTKVPRRMANTSL